MTDFAPIPRLTAAQARRAEALRFVKVLFPHLMPHQHQSLAQWIIRGSWKVDS